MHFKLTLPPVYAEVAERGAKDILAGARKQLGMVPNMYMNMANAPELLETYSIGYAGFRAHSGFTSAEQEVVFLTISAENECTYCVAAHSVLADRASGVPVEVTDAIRDRQRVGDDRLRTLHETTLELVRTRGWPSAESVRSFIDAGYNERQLLYLVLAASVKLISNYANHLFETPVDAAFLSREWTPPTR